MMVFVSQHRWMPNVQKRMIADSFMKRLCRCLIAFAAGSVVCLALGSDVVDENRPLLRIGAMSDNHLDPRRPKTHRRTEACFRLFRKFGVDVVVDTGDIADTSQVSELAYFRRLFDEAFEGADCIPFFCLAGHDYNYVPKTKQNDPTNIRNAARALGMTDENPAVTVRGYRFLNCYQTGDWDDFACRLERGIGETSCGKPVFVVTHEPPFGTTTGTEHWSSKKIRSVLDRYPQVFNLTGHIHSSIAWPANIWQGTFTSVNLGAHAEYSNKIGGEAVVIDVFADRIDIRRYEAESGREIGADDRWSVPLPLDPARGPYRPESRMQVLKVAEMPQDGSFAFIPGQMAALRFSAAEPRSAARRYRVVLESSASDGNWEFLSELNWPVPQVMDFPNSVRCEFPGAVLDAGRSHRARITPIDSYGRSGVARDFAFTVPADMLPAALPEELTAVARVTEGWKYDPERLAQVTPDGWISYSGGATAVVLPSGFAAAIQGKKELSLVFDVATDQPGNPVTLSVGSIHPSEWDVKPGAGKRLYTLGGRRERNRYAWLIDPGHYALDTLCCLIVREGDAGRFRVNSIRAYVR